MTQSQKASIRRWIFAVWAVCVCGFIFTAKGHAQDTYPRAFQLQQYRPWNDPYGILQSQSGRTLDQWHYRLGLQVNYARLPLLTRSPDGSRTIELMPHQFAADLTVGLGLLSWLDLLIHLPMTLYQDATIPAGAGFGNEARLSGFALSDLKAGLKFQALQEQKHMIALGLLLHIGLPTSSQNNFNGEKNVQFGATLALSRHISIVHLALNVGYRYQPRSVLSDLVLEHTLEYSLGAAIALHKDRLEWLVDLAGNTSLVQPAWRSSPLELHTGLRLFPLAHRDLSLGLSAGIGLTPGLGTPQFRIIAGVIWAPTVHDQDQDGVPDHRDRCPKVPGPRANQGCPYPDTDNDGLPDNIDKCPKVLGPRANQGCPYPDTDKDGLPDNIDKCPQQAGPKTNQGCPPDDIDKDGVPDKFDKCPKVPGARSNQGCPYPDTDKDGVPDPIDKCPRQQGPKANQGCPETDRDNDGIIDRLDRCPDLPGTKANQGCPGQVLAKIKGKRIVLHKPLRFSADGARIEKASLAVLQQVSQILQSRSEISIRIEGHTHRTNSPQRNLALSQQHAANVRQALVKLGIPARRLISAGFGQSKPITTTTPQAQQQNERIELHILPPHQ